VEGGWRRLHNEEFHNLYASPDIVKVVKSRRMIWVGHVARIAEMRNIYDTLAGKPEGKRLFGRPRRRWKEKFRIDFREVGWESVDCMQLTTVLTLQVP
jgi:hypothetical protein